MRPPPIIIRFSSRHYLEYLFGNSINIICKDLMKVGVKLTVNLLVIQKEL